MAKSVADLTATVKFEGELTPKAREVLRQIVREEMLKVFAELRLQEAARPMHPPEVK